MVTDPAALSSPATTPRERATMVDVAALAGVSLKTVSRVIDHVPTVDAALARRVHRAAQILDYRPDSSAANLRRSDRRTHTIGLLLDDVADTYCARVHSAIEDHLVRIDLHVFAHSLDRDPNRERRLVETLARRGVDGLMITPTGTDCRYLIDEQRRGVSLVFIDRPCLAGIADAVVPDYFGGAFAATEHLLKRGHRRICYIAADLAAACAADLAQGHQNALRQAGLANPAADIHAGLPAEEVRRVAYQVVANRDIEAVFAGDSLATVAVINAAHALGRQDDIAVVGFDDAPLNPAIRPDTPILVRSPAKVGQLAAECITRRLERDASPVEHHRVALAMLTRGSAER